MHRGNLNAIAAEIIIGQLQMIGLINPIMMNGGNAFIVILILLKYIQKQPLGRPQVVYVVLIVPLV
jgi:hypothetical protein